MRVSRERTWGPNKHNLICTSIQQQRANITLFCCFFSFLMFWAQVCWCVCAELTLLQQTTLLSSLVFQSQQLLLTVNGQGAQLPILVHLHPLLTVLHNPSERQNRNEDRLRKSRLRKSLLTQIVNSSSQLASSIHQGDVLLSFIQRSLRVSAGCAPF